MRKRTLSQHARARIALLWLIILCSWPWVACAQAPAWVTSQVSAPNVTRQIFFSAAVGAQVSYHVYLPDEYDQNPDARFPVLFYLHGAGGVLGGIAPISAQLSQAIAQGHLPPLIAVFPNGLPYGMWCDAESGLQPVESMVVQDLLPEIEARFRTQGGWRSRLVEGFSMGGYGAARFGLKHADKFAAFSMLGAGPLQLDFLADDPGLAPIALRQQILQQVYGNSLAIFEAQSPWRIAESSAAALRQGYPIRQLIGSLDSILPANQAFHQHLDAVPVAHQFLEVPGVGHDALGLIQAIGPSFFHFHRDALRAADRLMGDGFEAQ